MAVIGVKFVPAAEDTLEHGVVAGDEFDDDGIAGQFGGQGQDFIKRDAAANSGLENAFSKAMIGAPLQAVSSGRSSGVERNLATVEVVGSNPIARSIPRRRPP